MEENQEKERRTENVPSGNLFSSGTKIAGVGSPSSSGEVTLDLTPLGRQSKLVGATVAVLNDLGDNGEELGLGTVTEVITRNKWHEDVNFRGARNEDGILSGFSGDAGDQRDAKIKIQASWFREKGTQTWIPSGTQLGMSPATGTGVYLINEAVVDAVTETYTDLHYNGELGGSDNLPLPLSIPDNATPQGALHYGVFGRSGSGKALALDTPIPTPDGWKNMGELKAGDFVFTDTGEPTQVVQAHPVQEGRTCYTVIFSDGEHIIADGEHLWVVHDSTQKSQEGVVCDTETLHAVLNSKIGTQNLNENLTNVEKLLKYESFSVHVPEKIKFAAQENFTENVDYEAVYGEGKCALGNIQANKLAEKDAYALWDWYIRNDSKVRDQFLAGLLEGNVFVGKDGTKTYRTTSLVHTKLVRTLLILDGITPEASVEPVDVDYINAGNLHNPKPPLSGIVYYLIWNESSFRYKKITKIVETPSVPVRCISVDSPSRLYLAGRTFTPTHNTASACYTLAGQLRHENLGMMIVDPQGQWAAEHSLPFSFQGFAEELGRKVTVARVSEDLRLSEDGELFVELLNQTRFYNKIRIKHPPTQVIAGEEIVSILNNTEKWASLSSEKLLSIVLEQLRTPLVSGRIYTTDTTKDRFVDTITTILDSPKEFRNIAQEFYPIVNLFQEQNLSGKKRLPLWVALKNVFTRVHGEPAPLLIVDMSSKPPLSEEEQGEENLEMVYTVLDNDNMKAAILKNLFKTLKRESEKKFKEGENLNTMIVLDEAWRYAAPLNKISDDENEIEKLSKDLAGYARDTRKFGISWFYISQSPKSINQDIWEQIHIFMFGAGLNGSDLEKATEPYEDKTAALRLYKRFGNPIVTGVWPFLLQGPVSPLMSANAPLVLHMYTDFDEFRKHNHEWLKQHRDKLGKPTLEGLPVPPNAKVIKKGHVVRKPKTVKDSLLVTQKNNEHTSHAKDVGISDPDGFANSLDFI